MKILSNYHFIPIVEIELSKASDGTIKEYFPETSYIKEGNLHLHGEGPFCKFSISPEWKNKTGIYAFFVDEELFYIGQCQDLHIRMNHGYGNISPRNCYEGGQSTNCKINKIILAYIKKEKKVSLYFYEIPNINAIEIELIQKYTPPFNNQHIPSSRSTSSKKTIKKEKAFARAEGVGLKQSIISHIEHSFKEARKNGESQITLRAGDIHSQMGLNARQFSVCHAMRSIMKEKDIILEQPPKGNGPNLYILYNL